MLGRMASLMQRLQQFLRSPQGQRVIQQGQRQLAKPENQAKARRLLAKFQGRRKY
jgi:predicted house-cleaning NTP pyrophosphatase (Maf/HAM1 superfamily)